MDKALTAIAAAAALAAAAVVGVVAAAFALFAGFSLLVGQAWAAAIVAAAAALFVLIAILAVRSGGAPRRRHRRDDEAPDASLVQKVVELAKEHPLIAVGAAVGAGIYAIRNPQLVAAVVTAFMAGREEPR
jgi:protein-S-isoprenylcysteine O-methyltransferase Ste14